MEPALSCVEVLRHLVVRPILRGASANAVCSSHGDIPCSRLVLQVPLPEVSEQWEGYLLREIGSRATLSSQALPSCAFYTFVNTHQSLNCAAFTSVAACVAGE